MSATAFLDTGAIYALADRNDADHAAVRRGYLDIGRRFITHELVLVEALSLDHHFAQAGFILLV